MIFPGAVSRAQVTDDGKRNPDDMAGLPHFWEKFIDYVVAMKGTDRMVTPASDGTVV
jgi:hypothetical protein